MNMAENQNAETKVEQRDENEMYEAPKLEVIGKVDQLTSEFDGGVSGITDDR
jgi:hypothetical protein